MRLSSSTTLSPPPHFYHQVFRSDKNTPRQTLKALRMACNSSQGHRDTSPVALEFPGIKKEEGPTHCCLPSRHHLLKKNGQDTTHFNKKRTRPKENPLSPGANHSLSPTHYRTWSPVVRHALPHEALLFRLPKRVSQETAVLGSKT
jgi:hypothetical protein